MKSLQKEITTNLETGLTTQQVNQRIKEGESNSNNASKTQSIRKILFDNIFTFFNFINFVLAALILFTGSYRNLLFLGIVISNIVIGTWQEIKAKRTLDKLSLLASKSVDVLRNGKVKKLPEEDLVLGDIMVLSSGDQIPADAILATGALQVDQSLLTGESTPVLKEVGQQLLSGSVVIGGEGKAYVNEVGAKSFTGKLAEEAKKFNASQSQIQESLDTLIKVIALLLIPIGLVLFLKDFFLIHISLDSAIDSTAASLIAMIPQGLILLVSMVFAVAVIKLAADHTLMQRMSSVPTLARINMLCLDKTGTITEGKLELLKFATLDGFTDQEVRQTIKNIVDRLDNNNPTIAAILEALKRDKANPNIKIERVIPFSSFHKYSGVEYTLNGKTTSVVIGAPPYILGNDRPEILEEINKYAHQGDYIIMCSISDKPFPKSGDLPEDLKPASLILYRDPLRPSVPAALRFFIKQGIPIKIVSGDNPITASACAKRAGIKGYDKIGNMLDLKTYEDVKKSIKDTVVYGNCLPIQKKQVVEALRSEGYIVGYVGNGVNDILAIKDANISGAVADGAQAACVVADFVLLNSSFAPLPKIVIEGRKLINNLTRSAILYLSKTIFATLIVLLYLFLSKNYPFEPIQFSLISLVTIGLPSFGLAFEPNNELVHGNFLRNVLYKAIPAGITMFVGVGLIGIYSEIFNVSNDLASTLSVYALAFAGFLVVFELCWPFNLFRIILFALSLVIFGGAVIFFSHFFLLYTINFNELIVLAVVFVIELLLLIILNRPKIDTGITNVSMHGYNKLKDLSDKFRFKKHTNS